MKIYERKLKEKGFEGVDEVVWCNSKLKNVLGKLKLKVCGPLIVMNVW